MHHFGFEDKLTKDSFRGQDSCQADMDKVSTKLMRKDSRMNGIVRGSLLKLPNESTVSSALIRLTCPVVFITK